MPGPVSDSKPGHFAAAEDWADPDPIPIDIAEEIANLFDLEQIVILARRTGEAGSGVEHLMTWGQSDEHSAAADQIGQFVRTKVMDWEGEEGCIIMRDRVRLARGAKRLLEAAKAVGCSCDYQRSDGSVWHTVKCDTLRAAIAACESEAPAGSQPEKEDQ